MIRILICQLLIELLITTPVICQDARPPILHYTMKEGLSQMKTNSIAMDSAGYMWIGTRNGLNRFDGQNIVSYTKANGLPHDRIHDVIINGQGELVILTYRGISIFDGVRFSNFSADFLNAEYHMFPDHLDRIWILTHDETLLFTSDTLLSFNDRVVNSIVLDVDQNESYFISQGEINLFRDGQFKVIAEGHFGRLINQLHSNDRHLFYERSPDRSSWQFCYFENGVKNCLTRQEDYFEINPDIAFYEVRSDGSFSGHSRERSVIIEQSDFIRLVDGFKDRTGNFWLADENGFSVIQNSPFIHFPYRDLPYVWTINQDKNNQYWAGSFGYGLMNSPDGANFTSSEEVQSVTRSPYFLATSVTDHHGNLYLGHGQGIVRWNGHRFDLWLKDQPVYALAFDPQNHTLYAGSIGSVTALDTSGNIQSVTGTQDGLHPNDYIQNLSIDSLGQVWAGSYNGISIISPSLGQCRNFTESTNTLPCAGVFCSFTDEERTTWLGGDHGLMYYHTANDSIVQIRSHVLNSMVKSITRLDEDHLLIGSKDGLYIFNDQRFKENGDIDIHVLNTSNGYQGMEPGFTGFYQDNYENIWICSASSVDVLKKQDYSKYKSNLIPRIDKINDRTIPLKKTNRLIQIQPGTGDVRISINAIGLIRPRNVKFQWRLDNGEWSEWTAENNIVLNDLDHGDHRFVVRTGPTDLPVEQTLTDDISFEINLPFYLRSWFPFVAIGTMLGLLLLASLMYFRQRIENRRYVRQLAASKFLRSQLLLSELNPHFIFNILSSIQHKVLLGDRDEASLYIVKLSRMIRNFLTASHQSHRNLENYRENDISLEKELELLESYLEFEKMKSDDHFKYHISVSDDILPSQVFIPPMLIQPFVENAIKHGILLSENQGHIVIEISYLDEDLVITIDDDGIGREKAREIKGDRSGHVSLGTMIIDQRIELLNELGYDLKIMTEDALPQGTKVTIRLKE